MISLIVALTLAQPVSNGKFNNLTVQGTDKVAVLDAGVARVNGELTVLGDLQMSYDKKAQFGGNVYYSCNASLCYTNNDFGCAGSGTCNLGTGSHEWNQIRGASLVLTAGMTTTREFVLDKVSSGIGAGTLLATGTNYSGYKLPQAWTVTHVSLNVTTASTATVANTVLTITDGTNTCTATFACNTVTNTTGVKDVAVANGAGAGCVYAAASLVTISVTTQGCATAATVNSITTWGKPQ
jgi:hypothetical protein